MKKTSTGENKFSSRRLRQHELLVALIGQQEKLELIDTDNTRFDRASSHGNDPARLIDRNRRILKRYQDLVRSAITLDALLDSEQTETE